MELDYFDRKEKLNMLTNIVLSSGASPQFEN